jgi:hypothetical protein
MAKEKWNILVTRQALRKTPMRSGIFQGRCRQAGKRHFSPAERRYNISISSFSYLLQAWDDEAFSEGSAPY